MKAATNVALLSPRATARHGDLGTVRCLFPSSVLVHGRDSKSASRGMANDDGPDVVFVPASQDIIKNRMTRLKRKIIFLATRPRALKHCEAVCKSVSSTVISKCLVWRRSATAKNSGRAAVQGKLRLRAGPADLGYGP